jgi:hypothetical protein
MKAAPLGAAKPVARMGVNNIRCMVNLSFLWQFICHQYIGVMKDPN